MASNRFLRAVSVPISALVGAGQAVASWVNTAAKRSATYLMSDTTVDWRRVFGLPPRKGTRRFRRYITPNEALTVPAYAQALRVLSRSFAQCRIRFYKEGLGGPTEAKWHPIWRMLQRPSLDLDRHQFWSTMIFHYRHRGNAFASIKRLPDGNFNLTIMFPDWVECDNDKTTGDPIFVYKEPGKDPRPYWARDVIHLMGDTCDGRRGIDPIRQHQRSFDLIISTEDYACDYFEKGFSAAGFMSHPGPLDDDARENVQKSIRKFRGLDGDDQFGVLVGEDGATFTQITSDPEKAQLVASRDAGILEVSRITGVPPSFLMVPGSSYSTAEQEGMRLLSVAVGPILDQLVEQIHCKLMTPDELGAFCAVADLDPLLKTDALTWARICALECNWGALIPNEWRRMKWRKDVPGGNKAMRPMNMSTLGIDTNAGSAPPSSSAVVNLDPNAAPGETPIDQVANDPNPPTPAPGNTGAAADVAATGLNGAQIDSLIGIVTSVIQGLLPLSAGVAILKAAFPLLDDVQIKSIFGDVKPGSQNPAQPNPTKPGA